MRLARAPRGPDGRRIPIQRAPEPLGGDRPGLAIVGVQALENPFPFEPGQYATLGLVGPDGPKLIQRPMSVSSSADDLSEYEFFIRLVDAGGFTPLLWKRSVGDPINIKGPDLRR